MHSHHTHAGLLLQFLPALDAKCFGACTEETLANVLHTIAVTRPLQVAGRWQRPCRGLCRAVWAVWMRHLASRERRWVSRRAPCAGVASEDRVCVKKRPPGLTHESMPMQRKLVPLSIASSVIYIHLFPANWGITSGNRIDLFWKCLYHTPPRCHPWWLDVFDLGLGTSPCAGIGVVVSVRVDGLVVMQGVCVRLPVHMGAPGKKFCSRVIRALQQGEDERWRDNVQEKYADHNGDAPVVDN